MISKKFSLDWMDAGKGLLIAAGTAAGVIVQNSIEAGNLESLNIKTVVYAGLAAGLTYLIKNFLSAPTQPVVTDVQAEDKK